MGHDVYFQSPDEKANTPVINASYSFNSFYYIFNLTNYNGKTGEALYTPLTDAIATMYRSYTDLAPSKDAFKAIPGNYLMFLKLLQSYAKQHPTWIFHAE